MIDIREGLKGALGLLLWALFMVTVMVLADKSSDGDRWRSTRTWGKYPPEVHSWFPTVMQPGFEDMPDMGHSCCGSTDSFEGKITGEDPILGISVLIEDGKTIIPDGTVVYAPRSKIQTKYGNPTGVVVVFVSVGDQETVYCLIPLSGT